MKTCDGNALLHAQRSAMRRRVSPIRWTAKKRRRKTGSC